MATREQYFSLLGRVADIRTQMAGLLASERPGDIHTRELLSTELASLEKGLQELLSGDAPLPADSGAAAVLGLGPDAALGAGAVPTPIGVPSYDEAVVSERLYAVGDLYYCYQMERLGMFRAVTRLKDLFRAGELRLTSGQGAFGIYRFDRKEVLRYTRKERLQAYRRVFGYTNVTPPAGSRPNGSFHGLFSNFNLRIAELFRDKRISETIRPGGSAVDLGFGSIAIARRAGLDLRSNLKNASYGDVSVLTLELLQVIADAFRILEAPDVRHQFGTDNGWDTLEEILQRYLKEEPVVSQRSRMGETGREIIHWLAQSFILTQGRTAFEALAQAIAEPAEEWITSAQALSTMQQGPRSSGGRNVVPFPQSRATIA